VRPHPHPRVIFQFRLLMMSSRAGYRKRSLARQNSSLRVYRWQSSTCSLVPSGMLC
jgi:hypothetical protein